ncbi:YwpF family protein [Metabacillus arenae]|uniref:YwpF-like protein n=1 Tax=Metabacillus arenae TaxID=2771434 RepID=A0A926RZ11_9BACI|nr:YwpF family protein [Metabacillus arenae]MBD1382636.1 hypothetical protein [Metabacillus arenae]
MKTFKLVGLEIERKVMQNKKFEELPLEGGLIINREDGENRWLIEALLDKQYLELFEPLLQQHTEIHLLATISKKANVPAKIFGNVKSITVLEEHISILIDGKIGRGSSIEEAESILGGLLSKGLEGDTLLKEFKTELHRRKKNVRNTSV